MAFFRQYLLFFFEVQDYCFSNSYCAVNFTGIISKYRLPIFLSEQKMFIKSSFAVCNNQSYWNSRRPLLQIHYYKFCTDLRTIFRKRDNWTSRFKIFFVLLMTMTSWNNIWYHTLHCYGILNLEPLISAVHNT